MITIVYFCLLVILLISIKTILFTSIDKFQSQSQSNVPSTSSNTENETSSTTASSGGNSCCGVDVVSNELDNLDRCIVQHINVDDGYRTWKETDETNDCGSPHWILAKTSNCQRIAAEYKQHIDNLGIGDIIDGDHTSCSCRYQNRDGNNYDSTRMEVFLRNRNNACDSGELENPEQIGISDYKVEVKQCA